MYRIFIVRAKSFHLWIHDHYACRDDPTQIRNTYEFLSILCFNLTHTLTSPSFISFDIMDCVCIFSEEWRLSLYVILSGKIWDFRLIINFHLEIQTKAFLHYNSCLGSYREVFSSDRSWRCHNVCVTVCVAHKFVYRALNHLSGSKLQSDSALSYQSVIQF